VRGVLIDLHAVRFLESTSVGVLVGGRRLAEDRGIGYRVVNPEGVVRYVLETAVSWTTYVASHQADRAERGVPRAAG